MIYRPLPAVLAVLTVMAVPGCSLGSQGGDGSATAADGATETVATERSTTSATLDGGSPSPTSTSPDDGRTTGGSSDGDPPVPPKTLPPKTLPPKTLPPEIQPPGAPPAEPPGEDLERVQLPLEFGRASFESPTGNIQCSVSDDGYVECHVFEADWSIPYPGDCELDWADTEVSLTADGPFPGACRGDTFLVADPPRLLYGQEFVLADMRCVSQEAGVTCEHRPTGSGFTVSRTDSTLF